MCAAPSSNATHWYPVEREVANPRATTQAFRILLDQFYALQDQHNALRKEHEALKAKVPATSSGPAPGSGPTDSMLLGLRILPIDTKSLADGTKLTYVKKQGHFEFL